MREIKINGAFVPLYFGMRAIAEFSKKNDQNFEEVIDGGGLENIDKVVRLGVVGLNEGARRSGSMVRYTEDQLWDAIDENPSIITEISTAFMESVTPLMEKLGVKPEDFPTPPQPE